MVKAFGWHLIKALKMIDPSQSNEDLLKRMAMMEAQMQNAQAQLQREREEKEKKDRLLNFQMEQRRREEDEQRRLRFEMLEKEDSMRREIEQKERMLRAEREEKEMTMQMLKEKQNMLDSFTGDRPKSDLKYLSLGDSTIDLSSRKSSLPSIAPPCECLNVGFQNCMLNPAGFCNCSAGCSFVQNFLTEAEKNATAIYDNVEMVTMRKFSGVMTPINGEASIMTPSLLQDSLQDLERQRKSGNFLAPPGQDSMSNMFGLSPTPPSSTTSSSSKSSNRTVKQKAPLTNNSRQNNNKANNKAANNNKAEKKGANSKPLKKPPVKNGS
eukprot:10756.XXX_255805_238173_1 [CDS] Oithona nana genome sequencing.